MDNQGTYNVIDHSVNGDNADRIRGGGGPGAAIEPDEDAEKTPLTIIPVREWEGQLVYLEVEAREGEQSRGNQVFMGYVQALAGEDLAKNEDEIEEVPVALFYAETIGLFAGMFPLSLG